ADYFKQARLPRKNWNTIDDLAPQLAEFDLRCEGQDYQTAADVLGDISSGYLKRWGWNRRVVELNERLLGKLGDARLESVFLISQGGALLSLGQAKRAVDYFERALAISRRLGDRRRERISLRGQGRCYGYLGLTTRALDYLEQALAIKRQLG